MLQYPIVLPEPLRMGAGYTRISPVQKSKDRVNGPRTRRRRFKSTPEYLDVKFRFRTSEQAAMFEAWLEYALGSSIKRFMLPLKHPAATGMTYHGHADVGLFEVCFDDWPDGGKLVDQSKDVWEYTATLELRKKPFKGEDWLLDHLTGYPGGISGLNAALLNIFPRWDTDKWRTDPK